MLKDGEARVSDNEPKPNISLFGIDLAQWPETSHQFDIKTLEHIKEGCIACRDLERMRLCSDGAYRMIPLEEYNEIKKSKEVAGE